MRKWIVALLLFALTAGCWADETRQANLERLQGLGFKVASSLPVDQGKQLRPQAEIEKRLEALQTLILWVAGPTDAAKDKAVQTRALSGDLSAWLTDDEKDIFRLSKAQAYDQHIDTIGWRMENAWGLAWVLGYEKAPALSGQIQGEQVRELILGFCAKKLYQPRTLKEVQQMEDLFYCAHNAVRSAQLGRDTVPDGFDPLADGGGIHERRHSLTWCLSPGVTWEDTDLST